MSYHYFIKVVGKEQGTFVSDSPQAGEGKSLCHGFQFVSTTSNDPHRGKGGAARSQDQFLVTKPFGPSSPNFAAAFWGNEILSEVHLQFLRADGSSDAAPFHEIQLKNATIAHYEMRAGTLLGGASLPGSPEVELIGFRYEEMEVRNVPGKTRARYQMRNQ